MPKLDYAAMKTQRIEIDITQKELSEKTGINLNTIKAMETGRMIPDKENLQKLAEALGLSLEEIYFADFRPTKILSFINNKGGCGKTSLCSSLGYVLAEMGYRVLLVDTDSQRNLTSSYGMPKSPMHFGDAVLNERDIRDYIVKTPYENIDFVVGDVTMGTLDMALFTKMHRENLVRQILGPLKAQGIYDFVFLDTNPNLSLLNFNIVNASDYCIIPVQPASFDVEGIVTVIDFINGVAKFNPELSVLGIVINRYDARNKIITETAMNELKEAYGPLLFETIIQVDVKLQNAQWENKPVFYYANSRISREYRALAREVLKRCQA